MGTVYRRRDVDQHAVVLLLVLVGLGSRVWVLHWLALGTAAAAVAAAYLYQWTCGFHGRAVGIIPAHFASTLFEGKPLVHIFGKPMIQMVMQISQLNSHAFYTWIHLKEVTVDLRISFREWSFDKKGLLARNHHDQMPAKEILPAAVQQGLCSYLENSFLRLNLNFLPPGSRWKMHLEKVQQVDHLHTWLSVQIKNLQMWDRLWMALMYQKSKMFMSLEVLV